MSAFFSFLNRLWRIVMTGFCFALFGTGGLLLSVVWFNILLIFVRDPARRRRIARRSIAASFRLFLTVTRVLGVLDYHIAGRDILRQERGCLVVANHPTLIDYVLLASVMPETDCLVKSALLKNPFLSGVVRAADYLINSQADALLPASRQRLAQGDTLLIFPEGTRTTPGETMTLQRGAANIAVRCNSDLRIVTIHCSERMLDKKSKWYQVPPTKPRFTIQVGDRVRIGKFYDANSQEPALAARQLNRHLLLQLQPGNLPFSGINDASALS
ncbi:1-acyl-sn-glycerol-3-phosphate acyltransferase [Citrobacter amalonaticus]|uniref:1-acyl-sn-glycerol-3-phosphate acyltransferase n=2 Tax=Citrobacter amalonaticus TaxID=35703 RepID=A0A2S4RUV1_CITAM|nr:lysophospholipid acyltransferase family protein [Citrobacter amalonaticus]POT55482.1 1-acyl-sn-glycerol-3-phosphate acyltransferase [Citrobacter amalonaticus]POT73693.1 1-acyl-sn-glycerol-3-phosphate acyltransferase [Citrobacter amalonaticus]POU63918.1 1-acyl-sn-glycerol-3-phosphate acyltransferase [Citrobacter amalonaticus]POV03551.1 1-acyl-sn-glycerol-3-phosphate acyltransferase [Citrobacter amalonaticus]